MEQHVDNSYLNKQLQQDQNSEGPQLFDNMSLSQQNPFENLQLSSQLKESNNQIQNRNEEDQQQNYDYKKMMKMSKKQRKKQKKMKKLKAAKSKRQKSNKKQNIDQNVQVSSKKQGKKMNLDSEQQNQSRIQLNKQDVEQQRNVLKKKKQKISSLSDEQQEKNNKQEMDSDQYSSEKLQSSQSQGLANLNPNQMQEGRQFKKKLGRKSRKERILKKEGFDLKELGNDGDVNYELNNSVNESDDSYSEAGKKKKKQKNSNKKEKKEKKQKLTNQQLIDKLKQIGCQEDGDQNQSQKYSYDSGIDQINRMKSKKQSKNTIKMQNKMFGDIQFQQQNPEGENIIPQEKLQLLLKPKSSISSSKAGIFLNKVQALKKHRGLEADIDQQEFQKISKQKVKRSISQLVTKIQNQIQDHQQIDIQIKAPTIAKGRSGDLINNTMFMMRSLSQRNTVNGQQRVNMSFEQKQENSMNRIQNMEKKSISSYNMNQGSKSKKGVSRLDFFKQIKESINERRSKYITTEQLKNSFKASKLQQLEQIRKKIESKRRKQAMYELGQIEDEDADNFINELEQQLAKKDGISKADLRKLLRLQEGLEELGEYEEEEQKKKKKPKNENEDKVEGELNEVNKSEKLELKGQKENLKGEKENQKGEKEELKGEKDVCVKEGRQKLKEGLLMKNGQNKINKKLQVQVQENDGHADDMIEEYEGIEEKQEMDLEQPEERELDEDEERMMCEGEADDQDNQEADDQDQDNQEEEDDDDYAENGDEENDDGDANDNDQGENDHSDPNRHENNSNPKNTTQHKKSLNNKKKNTTQLQKSLTNKQKPSLLANSHPSNINSQSLPNKQPKNQLHPQLSNTLQQNQLNQALRKELQEQGIIMPGTYYKKKPTPLQNINISSYFVSQQEPTTNQNNQNNLTQTIINSESPIKNGQANSLNPQETLQFKQFKKLRKIAVVIQQKKKIKQQQMKRAKQFFQQEAQLGSDNQDNDDHVKNINKKQDADQYDGDDLDQQLQELIDNAVDINEADQQEAFKKYMEDVKQKDREQLQKILRGEFRKPNHDQLLQMQQMDEDERNRMQRMQKMVDWMKKRQDDQNGMYIKNDSDQDDEMNYYYDYNGTRKRVADKKNKNFDQQMNGQQTLQQDQEVIDRKLQYYLMDTISPAKRQTDVQINTQLMMQLPTMMRKNNKSLIETFQKKNGLMHKHNQNQSKQISKVFSGNLLSLVTNKNQKSTSLIPKSKKISSHMSEYLNKTKVPSSIAKQASNIKLPGIFNRVITAKK